MANTTVEMMAAKNSEACEVDLYDVLKERVEAGEPIYISGQRNAAIESAISGLAKEAGKPVRVVQMVETDTTSFQNASSDFVEAVRTNSNAGITLKN
ncbi:hypothetical protein LA345_36665 (plasmid) [Burkholderia vietnamiensis]|nr:hypothetical protein [Burkholderia vietnamiensis]